VHRRRRAGQVEQVLDVADALYLACPVHELVDEVGVGKLAPQLDHAVLCVDVDLALRHVCVAEDLRLDLVSERRVIGLRFRLLLQVRHLLRDPVRLRGDAVAGSRSLAARTPERCERPVSQHVTPPTPALRVHEVRDKHAEREPLEGIAYLHPSNPLAVSRIGRDNRSGRHQNVPHLTRGEARLSATAAARS
jgi:hypothetical protein